MKKYQFLAGFVMAFLATIGIQHVLFAAEILSVEGSVQVQSVSGDEWKRAEKGMALAVGDLIRTARRSSAEIALDMEKKNTLKVEEKTLVALNSAGGGTLDRLDLSKGKVYASLEGIKSGLTFEVNTPSAVAGVRGSALSVYVERDSDEIIAFKDTVFIKAFDEQRNLLSETMLPEGFKTYVERFGDISYFSQVSNREFERFDDRMDKIEAGIEGRSLREKYREQREDLKAEGKTLQEQATQLIEDQQGVVQDLIDTVQDVIDERKTQELLDDVKGSHVEPWDNPDHPSYCFYHPQEC